jgi:Domain of unknown function (DUF4905)
MEIDSLQKLIFVEVRESADKKVYFSSISLDDGSVFFDGLQTEERWMTGIEAAYDGVLLLHNYQSEAGPVHKGLMAVDGMNGHSIWSNYNYAFDHLSSGGPVVYDTRIQPHTPFLIDIRTGAIERPYNPLIDTEMNNYLSLPHLVSPEFLESLQLNITPQGNASHYLEYNNFRIVSLHAFAGGALEQRLLILRGDDIVYEDFLNTDIQKLQPEAFLMQKDHLIYLKNKSKLVVLKL